MILSEISSAPPGSVLFPEMVELAEVPEGSMFKHINRYFIVLHQHMRRVDAFDITGAHVTDFSYTLNVQKVDAALVVTPIHTKVEPQ